MSNDDLVTQLTKELISQGRIIEAGWRSYEILVVPATAPEVQRVESRRAFFAGAEHLYGSMLTSLDPGAEPTGDDMRRMEQIDGELTAFLRELETEVKRRSR